MQTEYIVVVSNGENSLEFRFVNLCDATDFSSTCLECGNDGTVIMIKRIEED